MGHAGAPRVLFLAFGLTWPGGCSSLTPWLCPVPSVTSLGLSPLTHSAQDPLLSAVGPQLVMEGDSSLQLRVFDLNCW